MEKGVLWGIAIVLVIALYCGFVIRRKIRNAKAGRCCGCSGCPGSCGRPVKGEDHASHLLRKRKH